MTNKESSRSSSPQRLGKDLNAVDTKNKRTAQAALKQRELIEELNDMDEEAREKGQTSSGDNPSVNPYRLQGG